MIDSCVTKVRWEELFPSLNIKADKSLHFLLDSSRLIKLKAGDIAFVSGSTCQHYLLLTKGQIRVQIITSTGRQVVLYHVNPGDDCVLTTSCLFASDCYPAEGIAITDAAAIVIPASQFHLAIEKSVLFRQFVFSTFNRSDCSHGDVLFFLGR